MGVIHIMKKEYDAAIERFTELYAEHQRKCQVRLPAQRIEGITIDEQLYFVIITNLIIAYMMREQE